MTAYEEIKLEGKLEGREKGKLEGREKGKLEAKEEIIKNLFQKFPDWSDKKIAEIMETTQKFVKEMRKKISKK